MKSSKMDNLHNYDPSLENPAAVSPFSFYQPFQSSFDPGFGLPIYQNSYQLTCDSTPTEAAAEKPIETPPGDTFWSSLSPCPTSPTHPLLPTTSTSPWGDVTRRIVSNSTWITPATIAPKPPAPAMEESPASRALGHPEGYTQFQQNYLSVYRDLCGGRSGSSVGLGDPQGCSVGRQRGESVRSGMRQDSSLRSGRHQESSLWSGRHQESSLWSGRLQELSLGFGRLEESSVAGRGQESERGEGSSYAFRRVHKSPVETGRVEERCLESGRLEESPLELRRLEESTFGLRSGSSSQAQRSATRREKFYPLILNQLSWNISQNMNISGGANRPMVCSFCKNNKEVPDIYLSHYLYDPDTKILTCPVLRKHVCEICGGTGDQAHTLRFCPMNRGKEFQAKIPLLLKTRTITDSTGKIRRN